jgi:hypothetical protein
MSLTKMIEVVEPDTHGPEDESGGDSFWTSEME